MSAARFIKRAMDITGGCALLLLLAPVMVVIASAVLLTSGRPILFGQPRPGLNQAPFTMYKFRTMRPARDRQEFWHGDDIRTTSLGRFLRRTSLDELPQLVHVVTGRMSLVGPRPLLVEFLAHYRPEHLCRHAVRPGLTGLAQVSGRCSLTLGQRLDLDIRYVDEWSLGLDIRILFQTLRVPFQPGYVPGQSIEDIDDLNLCADSTATK